MFIISTVDTCVFYLKVDLEPQKRTDTLKKYLQNFISSRDGPEKVQKQDRDEKHNKTTLHLLCIFCSVAGTNTGGCPGGHKTPLFTNKNEWPTTQLYQINNLNAG